MNALIKNLEKNTHMTKTWNGANAYGLGTLPAVQELFALGGAKRFDTPDGILELFVNAFLEDKNLALKCLFYLRDIRGGQGERRFFRICFKWLCDNEPTVAMRLSELIPMYGRIDDVLVALDSTQPAVREYVCKMIKSWIDLDLVRYENGTMLSLAAKWLPSPNASSKQTKRYASIIRRHMGMTEKEYRKCLVKLRSKLNLVETAMSEDQWEDIEFEKLPSKAAFMYRNAFLSHDETRERFRNFLAPKADGESKVKGTSLNPADIVHAVLGSSYEEGDLWQGYWDALPDYFNGAVDNIMPVVDTSGSMTYNPNNHTITPLDAAIGLGLYCAEKNSGEWKDRVMTFSERPTFFDLSSIKTSVDKMRKIRRNTIVSNTNLEAVFDLILETYLVSPDEDCELPEKIIIISDEQIDVMTEKPCETAMESVRRKWDIVGVEMPHLIYWNVNAMNNAILEKGDITFISGYNPNIFKQILSGATGLQLMLEAIDTKRYAPVHI